MTDTTTTPSPPIPADAADAARWEWTRFLRRLMDDQWMSDLERRLHGQIGHIRREAWGDLADDTSNPYLVIWASVAKSYDDEGVVGHADQGAADTMSTTLTSAGWWPLMRSVSRDLLGLREMFIRVDISEGEPTFRPVTPDMITVRCHPDRPGVPVEIREARLRRRPDSGRMHWAWDVLDISDPENPRYQVIDARTGHEGADLSDVYLGVSGGLTGDSYPYTRSDGRPILPYACWHAASTGKMWNTWQTARMAKGTLLVGVRRTHLAHAILQASWAQRWATDLELPSAGFTDENGDGRGRNSVVTDQSSVVMFRSAPEAQGQPQIGQWASPADIEKMSEEIDRFEQRLIQMAGINPSDHQRSDPRSGFALAVSRDSQREVQRTYEPQYRAGDVQLMSIVAVLLNRATGSSLPEDGWQITYRGIPLSIEERRAIREELSALVADGLMSRVEAYMELHPGTSPDEAVRALEEINRVNTRFRAA